jgi:HSP20 family protein
MSSFLEKLQRGMAAQNPDEETKTEGGGENQVFGEGAPQENAVFAAYKTGTGAKKGVPPLTQKDPAKKIITAENIDQATAALETPAPKTKAAPTGKKNKKTMAKKIITAQEEADREWLNDEGRLAVNVYQTENDLVLQAAIAGVKADDMEVIIEDEMVVIKGDRQNPLPEDGDYFIEECYWGPFSRKIILPLEVDSGRADASMKDGILTIRLPKIQREKKKKLLVKE